MEGIEQLNKTFKTRNSNKPDSKIILYLQFREETWNRARYIWSIYYSGCEWKISAELKRAEISVGHEGRGIFLIPRVLYGLIAKRLKGKRVDWNPCVIDKLMSTSVKENRADFVEA